MPHRSPLRVVQSMGSQILRTVGYVYKNYALRSLGKLAPHALRPQAIRGRMKYVSDRAHRVNNLLAAVSSTTRLYVHLQTRRVCRFGSVGGGGGSGLEACPSGVDWSSPPACAQHLSLDGGNGECCNSTSMCRGVAKRPIVRAARDDQLVPRSTRRGPSLDVCRWVFRWLPRNRRINSAAVNRRGYCRHPFVTSRESSRRRSFTQRVSSTASFAGSSPIFLDEKLCLFFRPNRTGGRTRPRRTVGGTVRPPPRSRWRKRRLTGC